MKIGFYSPYFDSLGGGERYVFTLAGHWSKHHDVSIFCNDLGIVEKAQDRFHLDLSRVKTVSNFFSDASRLSKIFLSSQYDCIFFLSDGSVPSSWATHNILHFQVPFPRISFPFWKRIKTDAIICNSMFTKNTIDPSIGKLADVIYPPVDIHQFQKGKKEKVILSVGRFSSHFQAKKQEILINMFTRGVKNGLLRGWKLILAGGLLSSDDKYFKSITSKTNGLPIQCIANISFTHLQELYANSSIYWHAAGYGETNPQYMEHFGMTTVEAMAAECIPIVYNAGGQPEIIEHEKSGYIWNTQDECLLYTQKVIHSEKMREDMQAQAKQRAELFSIELFYRRFDALLFAFEKKNNV